MLHCCYRGEELYDVVSLYNDIVCFQSGKHKFPGFGVNHNWVKQSIFWELFYWKTNLFCHNLNVMHIENNMFENIFNTIMDVKWKIKNNIKTRMNISFFFQCKNIELVYDGLRVAKSIANFVLHKNVQLLVYQ
jgi:hypothetical protein